MGKVIKLNEQSLNKLVTESVRRVLKEMALSNDEEQNEIEYFAHYGARMLEKSDRDKIQRMVDSGMLKIKGDYGNGIYWGYLIPEYGSEKTVFISSATYNIYLKDR